MKQLILALLLFSHQAIACVVGPTQIDLQSTIDRESGFSITTKPDEFCTNCSFLEIEVPGEYKGKPLAHVLYATYLKDKEISKWVTEFHHDTKNNKYAGLVSNTEGYRFVIHYLYGDRGQRCMSYEFKYAH